MVTRSSIPECKVARIFHEPQSSIAIKVKKGWSYGSARRLRFNMRCGADPSPLISLNVQ
jgi:hypothetical protein